MSKSSCHVPSKTTPLTVSFRAASILSILMMATLLSRPSLTFAAREGSSSVTASTSRRAVFIGWLQHVPKVVSSNTDDSVAKSFHRPCLDLSRVASRAQTCTEATGSSFSTVSRGGGGVDETNETLYRRAFIAVGSNIGDRYGNIASGLDLLAKSEDVRIIRTSYLRETAPMYNTDQPAFLNGMVEIETMLSPHDLLRRIKNVEESLGRDLERSERNGPRPLDLDIIMYDSDDEGNSLILTSDTLTIPHIGIAEREFVLSPLCDLDKDILHPVQNVSAGELLENILEEGTSCQDNESKPGFDAVRVIPLPRGRMLSFNETVVMGILNVTPDSFSDGGDLKGSADIAANQALEMVKDGADIIDIGGESTRPGANEVAIHEELQRTVPVIEKVRAHMSDIPISIDTRNAAVAKAAIEAGADIVNDVSGGTYDPDMLATVAKLRVPMVLMHMRGNPKTMQSMTKYEDVVSEVAATLLERSLDAERAGIPRCMQILDPGIGFAKDFDGNLQLLKHCGRLRQLVGDFPILLGPSRKGFLGKIIGEDVPSERDYGTAAACLAGLCGDENRHGCTILRVHNVRGIKQAARVMDAIQRQKQ
mmetsp:Transcript_21716/g.47342  ORF Transcript_21716/g.47342 Transcript_21716/m.47342 type:complete len:593 (+) Transcript_21716:109-1887(+)